MTQHDKSQHGSLPKSDNDAKQQQQSGTTRKPATDDQDMDSRRHKSQTQKDTGSMKNDNDDSRKGR